MRDEEYVELLKSTIGRSSGRAPAMVRATLRALSAAAPSVAVRVADRLFMTPPRHRAPAREVEALASARRRSLRIDGGAVATWAWPAAGPAVVLVHGWGGRGGQLAAFVRPLLERNLAVVAFDAPGHGASGPGPATLPRLVAALRAVAGAHGPVHGIVAHSLGAIAAARALHDGLPARCAVFVAPSATLTGPSARFADMLGFSASVRDRMERRIQERVGVAWSAFDVPRLAPHQVVPLLVVHDREDAEVPWQDGAAIARAWPGAALLQTGGLGHRRILRDPDVVSATVGFVERHLDAPLAAERPATAAAR